jgi:hypothetical protein
VTLNNHERLKLRDVVKLSVYEIAISAVRQILRSTYLK